MLPACPPASDLAIRLNILSNMSIGSNFYYVLEVNTTNIGNLAAIQSQTQTTYGGLNYQTIYVSELAAGQTYQSYLLVQCRQNATVFSAAADYLDQVANESDEGNNGASLTIPGCVPADLVISALSIPSEMVAGRTYSGSVTTTNIGNLPALPSNTRVKYGNRLLSDQGVPLLTSGASYTQNFNVSCSGTENTKTVFALADSMGFVNESNELNNGLSVNVRCTFTSVNPTNRTIQAVTIDRDLGPG